MKDSKTNTSLLKLISFCNTQITNNTEYQISRALINAVNHADDMSLEKLATEAAVSQTSISRFVRKAGFTSFQAFRKQYYSSMDQIHHAREMAHYREFGNMSGFEIMGKIQRRAVKNIQKTIDNVPSDVLMDVITDIRNARSVSFYGDDHALSDIYPLQLDILAAGIPCYVFKSIDIQKWHAASMKEGDLVIYLNVFADFMTKPEREMFKKMSQEGKAKMIGFFQDTTKEIEEMFDEVILYGIPKSQNRGFYSLLYLSMVLAELFYITNNTAVMADDE